MKTNQYLVRIEDRQGQAQVHALGPGQTIIGSAPSADICVLGEQDLLPQHILVTPRQQDCWVSTPVGAGLRNQGGEAVEACFVPWGSRLSLGGTQFELDKGPLAESPSREQISRNRGQAPSDTGRESRATPARVHPGLLMLLVITIALVGFGLLPQTAVSVTLPAQEEGELFAGPRGCPSANPWHRAQLAEQTADAKSERSVFDSQDGIAAVALYEEAAACYQLAGETEMSRGTADQAMALRQSLGQEYKRLRLRLELALRAGDHSIAIEQVQRLQAMLRHQKDSAPSHALRRLALRLSRKN